MAFHSLARKLTELAVALGLLTVDDLRRGPAHVFGWPESG
jgi:hypothetical protein